MSFIKNIQYKVHNYFLNKDINNTEVKRDVVNLRTARTIGILYDASLPENNILVTTFAEGLKSKGKQVTILGYVNDKKTESHYNTLLFNNKHINWYLKPSNKDIDAFIDSSFDILINAFTGNKIPLEYIAAKSKAKFRVGEYKSNKTYCYELMINLGENLELSYLLDQIIHFLKAIKTK